MKHQILRFQSEQEFQSFFGQLASAEYPDFQAIDGSSGDKGFDGLKGTTCFQVYYPEPGSKAATKYKTKIDDDVAKVVESSKELGIDLQEWVLVIPEDLTIEVVAHLIKKSNEVGFRCVHWGATKLTELITKHPHIQDSFPTMFLPPVQEGIKDIQGTLEAMSHPGAYEAGIEITTDDDFTNSMRVLTRESNKKLNPFYEGGRPNRTRFKEIIEIEKDFEEKYETLKQKKRRSDDAFKLELEDMEAENQKAIEVINNEMNQRGLYHSGIRIKELELLQEAYDRKLSKLKLKFGTKYGAHAMPIPEKLIEPQYYTSYPDGRTVTNRGKEYNGD